MTYDERYFILGVCAVTFLLSPLCARGATAETSTTASRQKECQTLTEEVQRSVQTSKTLGDALGNIDQDELMKKLLLCQVVTTGNEQAAKENEQATNGEAKYLEKPRWSFFLGDLEFRANAGYTETVGSSRLRPRISLPDRRPGKYRDRSDSSDNRARLDHRKEAYGVEVGWFGKPVLRDVSFLFFQKKIKEHRDAVEKAKKNGKGNLDSLFFDAVKLDLSFGYGRSIVDNLAGQQTLATYNKTFFTVAVHYSIPLRQFFKIGKFDPFKLPPPLPE